LATVPVPVEVRLFAAAAACAAVLGCRVSDGAHARTFAGPYPHTRTVAAAERLHGMVVPDPYRWLEELDAPEVREWAKAQTAQIRVLTGKIPS
jgi:hypothetical protein